MPRETHAPGPKTHVTPLQRYISTLLTCKVTLVLCHTYKLGAKVLWALSLVVSVFSNTPSSSLRARVPLFSPV